MAEYSSEGVTWEVLGWQIRWIGRPAWWPSSAACQKKRQRGAVGARFVVYEEGLIATMASEMDYYWGQVDVQEIAALL